MRNAQGLSLAAGLAIAVASGTVFAGSCGMDSNPGELDTNGDAKLSRQEVAGTKLGEHFDQVDTTDDGSINQMEWVHRCSSVRESSNESADSGSAQHTRSESESDRQDADADHQAQRQSSDQGNELSDRVEQGAEKAGSVVSKAVDSILGD